MAGLLPHTCDCYCDCVKTVAAGTVCARCRAGDHNHECANRCFDPDAPCEIGMAMAAEANNSVGVTGDW